MSGQVGREDLERYIALFEAHVARGAEGASDARKCIWNILTLRLPHRASRSRIADAVHDLADDGREEHALEATYLLRALDIQGLLTSSMHNEIERSVVSIVERDLPTLATLSGVANYRQTFEKYEKLRAVHRQVEDKLSPFFALQPDVDAIVSARQMLTRALNDALVKAYCAPFRISEMRAGFELVNNKLARLAKQPSNILSDFMDCESAIKEQIVYCTQHQNFLTNKYFRPYLENTREALDKFFHRIRGRFQAPISARLADMAFSKNAIPSESLAVTSGFQFLSKIAGKVLLLGLR